MREPTIARNYAETLVALAQKAGDLDGWGAMISDVASAIQRDERLQRFLESPRVSTERKNEILAKAFEDRLPRLLVRFFQAVITHRREALIPAVAVEYHNIVDEIKGLVHAQVTVARDPDNGLQSDIAQRLSRVIGRTVVPHFVVNPAILGGAIVRVGDTVMDGSVQNRLARLRSRLLDGAVR